MTSLEMYQDFQVYLDKIDSQDLPEIYPEQIFTFLNTAVDEYIQAVREAFEKNTKIADDAISLVKRVFIEPEVEENRVKFDYNKATLLRPNAEPIYQVIYYIINGYTESVYLDTQKNKEIEGISELNFIQQDDITVSIKDPFNKPVYADKIPTVREAEALYLTPPTSVVPKVFIGTAILKPSIISQTVNCSLREQVHKTIVKRAVEIALEDIESRRVSTFNK